MKVACVEKRPTPRRHLPERRLHPEQGPARLQRAVPPRPAPASPGTASRSAASTLDLPRCSPARTRSSRALTDGVGFLFKKNKVDADLRHRAGSPRRRHGRGRPATDGTKTTLEAKHILLATGSEPVDLPFLPFDGTDRRQLDRGPGLRPGARAPDRRRRRLHRPGAGLGLEAARGEGHRARVPAADPADDRRRDRRRCCRRSLDEAGARVPPGDEGHRARRSKGDRSPSRPRRRTARS